MGQLSRFEKRRRAWLANVEKLIDEKSSHDGFWSSISKGEIEKIHSWDTEMESDKLSMHQLVTRLQQRSHTGDLLATLAEIYTTATEAKPVFDAILRRTIDSLNSAMRESGMNDCDCIAMADEGVDGWDWWMKELELLGGSGAGAAGAALITMPLKDEKAADKKAKEGVDLRCNDPLVWTLLDITRAAVVCSSEHQIVKLMEHLHSVDDITIIRVKNRFRTPTIAGYRDILIHVGIDVPVMLAAAAVQAVRSSGPPTPLGATGKRNSFYAPSSSTSSLFSVAGGGGGGGVDGISSSCRFICEIQVHHRDMLLHSLVDNDNCSYRMYKMYRPYFKEPAKLEDIEAAKSRVVNSSASAAVAAVAGAVGPLSRKGSRREKRTMPLKSRGNSLTVNTINANMNSSNLFSLQAQMQMSKSVEMLSAADPDSTGGGSLSPSPPKRSSGAAPVFEVTIESKGSATPKRSSGASLFEGNPERKGSGLKDTATVINPLSDGLSESLLLTKMKLAPLDEHIGEVRHEAAGAATVADCRVALSAATITITDTSNTDSKNDTASNNNISTSESVVFSVQNPSAFTPTAAAYSPVGSPVAKPPGGVLTSTPAALTAPHSPHIADINTSRTKKLQAVAAGYTRLTLRLKVLRKTNQVADNPHQLETFIDTFLSGKGRVAKELDRHYAYFDLFKLVGEFALAEKVQRHAIDLLRARGNTHLIELGEALDSLSRLLTSLARFDEAVSLCEESLSIFERVRGRMHPLTVAQLSSLAGLAYCTRSYDRALHAHKTLLIKREEALGPYHTLTLRALQELAELCADIEDWTATRANYRELLLRLREIRRSSESQSTPMPNPLRGAIATPVPGLPGYTYTVIADDDAYSYYSQDEQELWYLDNEGGWDVSYTAEAVSVMAAMAEVDEIQGDLIASAKKWRAIVRAQEELYKYTIGNAPAEIAKSMTRLACIVDQMGRLSDALSLHERALHLRIVSRGPDHEETAESYCYTAELLYEMHSSKWKDARDMLEKAVKIREDGLQELVLLLQASATGGIEAAIATPSADHRGADTPQSSSAAAAAAVAAGAPKRVEMKSPEEAHTESLIMCASLRLATARYLLGRVLTSLQFEFHEEIRDDDTDASDVDDDAGPRKRASSSSHTSHRNNNHNGHSTSHGHSRRFYDPIVGVDIDTYDDLTEDQRDMEQMDDEDQADQLTRIEALARAWNMLVQSKDTRADILGPDDIATQQAALAENVTAELLQAASLRWQNIDAKLRARRETRFQKKIRRQLRRELKVKVVEETEARRRISMGLPPRTPTTRSAATSRPTTGRATPTSSSSRGELLKSPSVSALLSQGNSLKQVAAALTSTTPKGPSTTSNGKGVSFFAEGSFKNANVPELPGAITPGELPGGSITDDGSTLSLQTPATPASQQQRQRQRHHRGATPKSVRMNVPDEKADTDADAVSVISDTTAGTTAADSIVAALTPIKSRDRVLKISAESETAAAGNKQQLYQQQQQQQQQRANDSLGNKPSGEINGTTNKPSGEIKSILVHKQDNKNTASMNMNSSISTINTTAEDIDAHTYTYAHTYTDDGGRENGSMYANGLLATPVGTHVFEGGFAVVDIVTAPPVDLDDDEDDEEEEEEEFDDFEVLYPRLMPEEATSWKQLKDGLVEAEKLLEEAKELRDAGMYTQAFKICAQVCSLIDPDFDAEFSTDYNESEYAATHCEGIDAISISTDLLTVFGPIRDNLALGRLQASVPATEGAALPRATVTTATNPTGTGTAATGSRSTRPAAGMDEYLDARTGDHSNNELSSPMRRTTRETPILLPPNSSSSYKDSSNANTNHTYANTPTRQSALSSATTASAAASLQPVPQSLTPVSVSKVKSRLLQDLSQPSTPIPAAMGFNFSTTDSPTGSRTHTPTSEGARTPLRPFTDRFSSSFAADNSRVVLSLSLQLPDSELQPVSLAAVTVWTHVAATYEDCGHFAKAERLFAKSLATMRIIYRHHAHMNVVIAILNLAGVLKTQKKCMRALPLYAEAEDMIAVLNNDSAETTEVASVRKNKAQCLRALGKHTEARILCNSALDIFEDSVGEYDPDYSSCLNTIAVSYIQEDDLENAMDILERAVALRNEMLGTVHPTYGVVCSNKAAVDFMQGVPPTAGPMFARCLKIGETMIGASCRDVQSALTNLSGVFASQGLDNDAKSLVKGADMVKTLVEETEMKFQCQWQNCFVNDLKVYIQTHKPGSVI